MFLRLRSAHVSKIFAFCFFSILVIANISSHELWRDETDAWLVARDSRSFHELLLNVRYTGRPPLWYLILFGITHLSIDVTSLKLFTSLLAISTIALIIFPLNYQLKIKVLLLSGFYFLFGYTVLSRDYSLILIFLVLLFILYESAINPSTKNRLVLVICVILSSINVFSMLISVAILIQFLIFSRNISLKTIRSYFLESLLVAFNLLWLIYMFLLTIPPRDHYFSLHPPYEIKDFSYNSLKILAWKSVGFFAQTLFPYWGNYQVSHITVVPSLLGFVFIYVLVSNLKSRYKSFAIVVIILFYIFHVFGYSPYWWHRGSLTVILLLLGLTLVPASGPIKRNKGFLVIISILLIQTSGSLFGLGKTFWGATPYSNSATTSKFLEDKCKNNFLIVAENDLLASSLSAFLPKYHFYFLNRQEFGTFTSWKAKDYGRKMSTWGEVQRKKGNLYPCAYIFTLQSNALPPRDFKFVKFQNSVWGDDFLVVYLADDSR